FRAREHRTGLSAAGPVIRICILLAALLASPVAAAEASRLETWFADPAMDHAALSPSGSHIAAITSDGGVRRLVVFDEELRSRTVHAFTREQILSVQWAT